MKAITVKHPKNKQVVHLHHRQPFTVVMPMPAKREAGETWSSFAPSDYFTPIRTSTTDSRAEFSYVQLYDLKKWANHSCVHLGTISLIWRGQKRGDAFDPDKVIKVYVILEARKSEYHNKLVVINPVNEDIRLLPHQILEVVIFKDDCTFNREAPGIEWEKSPSDIHYESVAVKKSLHNYNAATKQFSILNGSTDLINRSLSTVPVNSAAKHHIGEITTWKGLTYRAYHYFLMVRESDHKKIHGLKNSHYSGGTILFNNPSPNATARDYSVNIDVEVVGSFKKRLHHVFGHRKDLARPYDIMSQDDRILTSSSYEKTNTSILNPRHGEPIEFIQGSTKEITLEMPPPHIFNEKLRGSNAIWKATYEPIIKISNPSNVQIEVRKLTVAALDHTASPQRFVISMIQGILLPSNTNTCLLGIISLTCDDDPSLNRKVICYLVGERSNIKIAQTIPSSFSGGHERHSHSPRRQYSVSKPVQPTHFVVKIEPSNDPLEAECVVTIYEKIADIPADDIDNNGKSKKKIHVDLPPHWSSEAHLL